MDEQQSEAPRRSRTKIVALGVALALLAGAVAFGLLRPAPASRERAGGTAPEFTLPRLTGGGAISSADLAGSPVIVNFWASWCNPCRREAPLLEKTWQDHRADGLTVLGVDLRDAPANARKFVRDHGITYPIVVDRGEHLADSLDVEGLPETFFIDSSWRLRPVGGASSTGVVVLGGVTADVLDEQVDALLGPTASPATQRP